MLTIKSKKYTSRYTNLFIKLISFIWKNVCINVYILYVFSYTNIVVVWKKNYKKLYNVAQHLIYKTEKRKKIIYEGKSTNTLYKHPLLIRKWKKYV